MKFITKVWHPNVSSVTGAICLDILKDQVSTLVAVNKHLLSLDPDPVVTTSLQWSPALTVKTALLSLQALLCSPEPNDPQDAVVATMYKERRPEFDATARQWTETYAAGTTAPTGEKDS